MRRSDQPTYMSPSDAEKVTKVIVERVKYVTPGDTEPWIRITLDGPFKEILNLNPNEARALVTKLTLLLAYEPDALGGRDYYELLGRKRPTCGPAPLTNPIEAAIQAESDLADTVEVQP